MILVERQLSEAREDRSKYKGLHCELVAALSRIKTEVEMRISLHVEDATATSAQAGGAPEGAEPRLIRAVECAQSGSQGQTFGDIQVGDISLSTEFERVETLEKREAALFAFEGAPSNVS